MRALVDDARRPARGADHPAAKSNEASLVPPEARTDLSATAPDLLALRRLSSKLMRYAPHDGVFPLQLPGTYALRVGRMTAEPVYATVRPSLCVVAQGAKVVIHGQTDGGRRTHGRVVVPRRFKVVTTMSPLQYQKAIRLNEARRLMLFQGLDATNASSKVGYVSTSQFSREYARAFGGPPAKDIARMRDLTEAVGVPPRRYPPR
jgi:hypothetical protein